MEPAITRQVTDDRVTGGLVCITDHQWAAELLQPRVSVRVARQRPVLLLIGHDGCGHAEGAHGAGRVGPWRGPVRLPHSPAVAGGAGSCRHAEGGDEQRDSADEGAWSHFGSPWITVARPDS